MPKVTFTATDPNGVVHTRSTTAGREYLFTVVFRRSYAHNLAKAIDESNAKVDAKNYSYHHVLVANGVPADASAYARSAYDRAVALTDGGKATLDEYCARAKAARIAGVEAEKAAGKFDEYRNAGWCSRRDLADKLAQSTRRDWHTLDVIVLPAIRK